jgi:hypothetical protein
VTRKAYVSAFTNNLATEVRATDELADSSRPHTTAQGQERRYDDAVITSVGAL